MRSSHRSQPSIGNTIGHLVDSHYRDRANLNRIRELGTVVSVTAAFIHELQKERGLSSGYVAGGRSFLKELEEQTARCEEAELRALDLWAALQPVSPLEAAMSDARGLLAELPRLRSDIRALALTPNAVVQRFSTLIDRLLVVIAEAPGHSPHPQVTLALIALFNFLLAKEYTGQLRALGSAVCAQRQFEPFQFQTFQAFGQRRNETLEVFSRHLGKEQLDQWDTLRESTNFRAFDALLARLERLGNGEGTAPAALDWFHAVTAVIDDMRQLEVKLLDELDRLCFQVFAEARSAWEDSQETPEERDRLFLARLERTHHRLQEERLQTRLSDLGKDTPAPTAASADLAEALAHDSAQAVEEAHRWRKDLERWMPLVRELAEGSRRARLLSLDASIDAVTPAEVARAAAELARQLMNLAEQLERRVAELRSSANQSVDSFETLHGDALQLRKRLLDIDPSSESTKM